MFERCQTAAVLPVARASFAKSMASRTAFFIEILPVNLILDRYKPAFFLLVSTDPE